MNHRQRYHILVNARSGTARKMGREKIEALIRDSPLVPESFDFLEPKSFDIRIQELRDSPLPILVGGGDGTIAKAAALHVKRRKAFSILPLGTMNLLARDLAIPIDISQSLKAHHDTKIIAIDIGMVNDVPFLCCIALGTMPEAAEFREENRDAPDYMVMPRLTACIFSQLDKTLEKQIKLTLDGHTRMINTSMLIVSNNRYTPVSSHVPFRKIPLRASIFGVYTVSPHNFLDKARLLIKMKTGQWRKDQDVYEVHSRNITIETKRQTELISIDGEPVEMQMPLKFTMMPHALRIIVPLTSPDMNPDINKVA